MLLDIFVDEFSSYSNIFFKKKRYSIYLSKRIFSIKNKNNVSNSRLNKINDLKAKREFLIKKILNFRKKLIIKIQSSIRRFLKYKKYKSFLIIKNIINRRIQSIILIQSIIRMGICRIHIKALLNNDVLFFYKFPLDIINKMYVFSSKYEELKQQLKNNKLNLSLIIHKPKMNLKFKFSRYLNSYYIAIKKIKLMRKNILVNFQINEEIIIDPRYSIIDDKGEKFYNILTSKMFYRKNNKEKLYFKKEKEIKKEKKQWEELFVMKSRRKRSMSYDASSISSKTDISKELDKNMGETYNNQVVQIKTFENVKKPLQSILKRKSQCFDNLKFQKKVSFEPKIELCE